MQKILVAHSSQELTLALQNLLDPDYEVITCHDGNSALDLIFRHHPDAVILDFMLRNKDGLTVLEEAGDAVAPVVLATTTHRSSYLEAAAQKHGIGYILLLPCDVRNIASRLQEMLSYAYPEGKVNTYHQELIAQTLLALGFSPSLDGFHQLKTGIPLYAEDTAQRLNKELYPAIARCCGYGNGQLVEHSIRGAIKDAWRHTSRDIWEEYFPGNPDICPTNKQFISRLATLLKK